jgi:hypothetical protein
VAAAGALASRGVLEGGGAALATAGGDAEGAGAGAGGLSQASSVARSRGARMILTPP